MKNILGENAELINQYVIPWGINIITAILIYLIGRWLAKLVVRSVDKLMTHANIDASLRKFSGNIISTVLTVFILIAALEQLGVDTTSIMAIFAAAGLAVGLALKDSLSNFSAGVMLIIFKPFKLGDLINAGGTTGVVEEIQIFNTIMRTGDNQIIIMPNGHIYGGSITNLSARETRRIDLVIGISYDDNIGKAKDLLKDVIARHSLVLTEPAPTIMVLELGESSIDLAVRPWVNSGDYWVVRSELLQTIKETFDEQGISIPYPQRSVHMISHPVENAA
ncbi:MAG: mechanosensitive ion channel [Gammaproteobacteria bacterium]|nr:mechanosensitive ion channel [Gammaproteobacteria bacterium]MDH5735092.1 mechanosensitive ion channel [Gammaproteobacteria bacterium]